MSTPNRGKTYKLRDNWSKGVICIIFMLLTSSFNIFSAEQKKPVNTSKHSEVATDSVRSPLRPVKFRQPGFRPDFIILDSTTANVDSLNIVEIDTIIPTDTISMVLPAQIDSTGISSTSERVMTFNPNPTRAVWLSALFPGLGQIYNRRYWKLPIVVGAYMGLGYATSWNNRMLSDYTRAYRDIMDTDPSTNSYMDFFPSTTKEENLDKTWLTNVLKSRKNYFRQNRDLCIICMVGVYLLAMVDAYVDASLSQFDISPDLSMQVAPTIMQEAPNKLPSVGVHWALCF